MAVFCGKDGTVKISGTDLPEITKWKFTTEVNAQEYSSNNTAGYKVKVCGSKSGSGTIEGKMDDADPITDHFEEGDTVTLVLYLNATLNISVPALITKMDFEVNIDDSEIVGWSADFESSGAYTYNL